MTEDKRNEVARQQPGGLPAKADFGDYAGMGTENLDRDDFKIPFLNLLQSLSPEVQSDDPKFIPGAEVGMFANSVTKQLFSGSDGVILVPCYREHHFVEWQPRNQGGGFVAIHATDSEVVQRAKAEAKSFKDLRTPAGNDLVDTFQLYCLRLNAVDAAEPAEIVVLSCTKTKIKRYREYMTRVGTFVLQDEEGNVLASPRDIPLFAHRLKVTATRERGAEGPYYNVLLEPAVGNDIEKSMIDPSTRKELMAAAAALNRSVKGGAKTADYDSQAAEAGHGDDAVFT